jgi:hypothetical protein
VQTRQDKGKIIATVFLLYASLVATSVVEGQQIPFVPNGAHFPNPGGASQTYSTTGKGIDLTGPFFQNLGNNGRTCGTCHQPSDGMSVSAADVQQRFDLTQGEEVTIVNSYSLLCINSVFVPFATQPYRHSTFPI